MMKVIQRLAARSRNARSERPVLIACLGDSVTHGCFDLLRAEDHSIVPRYLPDQGYAAGLSRRLRLLFPAAAVTVLNAGISGDNARGGLARLERDVLSFSPDLVTVNFGLNDSMREDVDAGIAAYQKYMRAIFEKIIASGAEAMLITPNFMCSYVSPVVEGEELRTIAGQAARVQTQGILSRYVDAARDIAQEMGIPVADAYRRWEQLARSAVDTTALLSNGINHPTAEMHSLFVEEILRTAFEA